MFIIFETTSGEIRAVHIYDGPPKISQFDDLHAEGVHLSSPDKQNTFELPAPHAMVFGVGVSFLFQADIGFDSPIAPPRLIVASIGGDYRN